MIFANIVVGIAAAVLLGAVVVYAGCATLLRVIDWLE